MFFFKFCFDIIICNLALNICRKCWQNLHWGSHDFVYCRLVNFDRFDFDLPNLEDSRDVVDEEEVYLFTFLFCEFDKKINFTKYKTKDKSFPFNK